MANRSTRAHRTRALIIRMYLSKEPELRTLKNVNEFRYDQPTHCLTARHGSSPSRAIALLGILWYSLSWSPPSQRQHLYGGCAMAQSWRVTNVHESPWLRMGFHELPLPLVALPSRRHDISWNFHAFKCPRRDLACHEYVHGVLMNLSDRCAMECPIVRPWDCRHRRCRGNHNDQH